MNFIGGCLSTNVVKNSTRFDENVLYDIVVSQPNVPVTLEFQNEHIIGHTEKFTIENDILYCEFVLSDNNQNVISGIRLMRYYVLPRVIMIKKWTRQEGPILVIGRATLECMGICLMPMDESLPCIRPI